MPTTQYTKYNARYTKYNTQYTHYRVYQITVQSKYREFAYYKVNDVNTVVLL